MRTYYSINVTNKCNKACSYCINRDYINNNEYPDVMGFGDLREWLELELKENDIAEIAGTGEPTLCEWLPDLLDYLERKDALIILRTNGVRLGSWRAAFRNLLVIFSRHDSSDDYVADRCGFLLPHDLILAVDTANAVGKNKTSEIVQLPCGKQSHDIERAFIVSPDGKVRFMPCQQRDMGTVWDYKPEGWTCTGFSRCPFVLNAYNFTEYLKSPCALPDGFNYVQAQSFTQ